MLVPAGRVYQLRLLRDVLARAIGEVMSAGKLCEGDDGLCEHTPSPWRFEPRKAGASHEITFGEYRSAIARAKKVLLAAGFEWSRTTGRYSPYGGSQHTTMGAKVTRAGCSDFVSVSVHVNTAYGRDFSPAAKRAAHFEYQRSVIEALRAGGMPFDDRGWLECGPKARKALAKAKGA